MCKHDLLFSLVDVVVCASADCSKINGVMTICYVFLVILGDAHPPVFLYYLFLFFPFTRNVNERDAFPQEC